MFIGANHEAIREWVAKGRELSYHTLTREKRKRVAADEKEIKVGKETVYL